MSDQEQHSGHSHATFLSGILIGILLALLFTTKRGRKLLKIVTDEGIGKFNKWEDLLSLLEEQIAGGITEEEPVMGEDLKEELKEIDVPKKAEVKNEKKEEKFEEEDEEVEKALDLDKKEETHTAIVEKIEEKVKEVEALATELREVKEAIEEKIEEVKEEEKTEEDLPLHKAVEEPVIEEPKKKSRRLFRGIRRK